MDETQAPSKKKIKLMQVFKHPKFYRIPRDKSEQAISWRTHDGGVQRAPGSGHKRKSSSNKQQAGEAQASSYKDSSSK